MAILLKFAVPPYFKRSSQDLYYWRGCQLDGSRCAETSRLCTVHATDLVGPSNHRSRTLLPLANTRWGSGHFLIHPRQIVQCLFRDWQAFGLVNATDLACPSSRFSFIPNILVNIVNLDDLPTYYSRTSHIWPSWDRAVVRTQKK